MMSEEAIVRAARRGDRRAFGELVERYSRAVLARHWAATGDMAQAEDLAQETFLRAWQGLRRLEEIRSFGSWLLAMAGYVAQEWIRRRQSAQRLRAALGREALPLRREESSDLPLAEAIARLPVPMQQLLALRHGRGLRCEEIGRELGMPLGTVTKTLSRAYAQLRGILVKT